jgi:hypothetical protein
LRTVPAIQRWRVLQDVPTDLTAAVPDEAKYKKEILGADDDKWKPAYGQVSGELPLADVLPAERSSRPADVLYLYGEIEVTEPGELEVMVTAPAKTNVWLDEKSFGETTRLKTKMETGEKKIVLRVKVDPKSPGSVKVEFAKPAGSTIEFAVVGGR